MPVHNLDQIQKRLVRVNRSLQRVFKGGVQELSEAVKQELTVDKNGNVTVEQLKNFVLGHLKEDLVHRRLFKQDVEGFLSSFIYNAYGTTNAADIAPLVFTEENYVAKKLTHRLRANPPPEGVNGEPLAQGEEEQGEGHRRRVREVMEKIEEKIFNGPVKMFQVFRQWDRDGDGYVSYADFEDTLQQLQIGASKQEVGTIMKVLDKEGKGYLDYRVFSTGIFPHMSNAVDIPLKELHLPNLAPNRAKVAELT